jgi:hypothetical protein
MARLPFEITAWGCRAAVKNLADKLNLEFIYKDEGGTFIFEYINGKVRGEFSKIKKFKEYLESM